MIHISRLKIRGFKSFKKAELTFPKGFICIAGPNGSGKSNIIDALRFAFGENKIRLMRVKKVSELISDTSKFAEVEVELEKDGKKISIKRAIREDGKVLYKLDGKKTSRLSIQNLLLSNNIDNSGRNIIGQGEITRLLNMSPKERRQVIDNIVGISEFESKKKDALKELDIVDQRINETNVLLGEKLATLDMLEKEREIAIKYKEFKNKYNKAKFTILKKQYKKYMEEFEEANKILNEVKNKTLDLDEKIKVFNEKINALEKEKTKYLEKIKEKNNNEESGLIENLKIEIAKEKEKLENLKANLTKINEEINEKTKNMESEIKEITKIESRIKRTSRELIEFEKKNINLEVFKLSDKRNELESEKSKLNELKNKEIEIKKEMEKIQILIEEKNRFEFEEEKFDEKKIKGEIELLKSDINEIKKETIKLFKREKEINNELAKLDRALLDTKTKIAELKAQNPRTATSRINTFLKEIVKKEKIKGFYGMVLDLIEFEPEYANAIEAAAGSRLMYFIVDSIDTATKLIEILKKSKMGRATFIPLDKIRNINEINAGLGSLTRYIHYKGEIDKAMRFIFGDTILIKDIKQAKQLGIGNYRMVTFDGEIFERSGLITGGKNKTSFLNASALRKLEEKENEIKELKNNLFNEISSIREKIAKLRNERTNKELKLKEYEIEYENIQKNKEKNKQIKEKIAKLRTEILKLREELRNKEEEYEKIIKEINKKMEYIKELEEKIKRQEEEEKKKNIEKNKEYAELVSKISSLKEKLNALDNEKKIRKEQIEKIKNEIEELKKSKKENEEEIKKLIKETMKKENILKEKEEQFKKANKETQDLFEKMKNLDEKIVEISKERSKIINERDKLKKQESNAMIKKTTSETRIKDISQELGRYEEEEELNLNEEELNKIMKEADEFLSAHENVNLASIELYEQKKAEVGDVREKIKTLQEEKESILNMIKEIEKKKKELFFEAFYEINDNFKKLFSKLGMGDGFLYLDKPTNPFESGLHIKIKRNDKIKNIEILSGGEKTLTLLMFIFAMQYTKPSPYYIFDEVDASLDKKNVKHLAQFIKEMSKESQFIIISHNDIVLSFADTVYGVSMQNGVSKVLSLNLKQFN